MDTADQYLHGEDDGSDRRVERGLDAVGRVGRAGDLPLVDRVGLPKVLAARLAVQPPEGCPTSTTIVVAGLADPELLVEVEAIAILCE